MNRASGIDCGDRPLRPPPRTSFPLVECEQQAVLLVGRDECRLVHEHHVPVLRPEQQEVQIGRRFQGLAEDFVQRPAHLLRNAVGDGRFPAPGGADHQGVVERAGVGTGGVQGHADLLDHGPLPDQGADGGRHDLVDFGVRHDRDPPHFWRMASTPKPVACNADATS